MSNSFSNQVIAQVELWENQGKFYGWQQYRKSGNRQFGKLGRDFCQWRDGKHRITRNIDDRTGVGRVEYVTGRLIDIGSAGTGNQRRSVNRNQVSEADRTTAGCARRQRGAYDTHGIDRGDVARGPVDQAMQIECSEGKRRLNIKRRGFDRLAKTG